MDDSALKYWNALALFGKFGSQRFKKMLRRFSSPEEAFKASAGQLIRCGLEDKLVEEFAVWREKIQPEREWAKLAAEGMTIITLKDAAYPKLLREIHNPPALLYVKGKLTAEDEFAVGVVGTRKISPYGRQVTPEIVRDLANSRLTVVSGLALGTDTLAHREALKCGGRTLAVLGSGINQQSVYPPANRGLAADIVKSGGALISENPFGTPPLKQNFPHRNRLIAGLSLGVLVVEAPAKSGALITAKFALEQNREIFAVPGSIYNPNSIGPNNLIKMGAKPATSAADILDGLSLTQAASFMENKRMIPDTREEAILLKYLGREPLHIDELKKICELDIAVIGGTLTMMEMKGKVRHLGGMYYVLAY